MKKGFSLPLWVAGAARSALKKLVKLPFDNYELIKIPNNKVEHVASTKRIKENSVITKSDKTKIKIVRCFR